MSGRIARFIWQRGKSLTGMRDLAGRNCDWRCHKFCCLAGSLYTYRFSCPCPRREGVWRSRGITPCILIVGLRLSWVVSFTLRSLHPHRRNSYYLLNRSLCGLQEGLDVSMKWKISFSLPVVESGFVQPVAFSLDRLLCPVSMYLHLHVFTFM